jgi:4'-phosphopantetheinyl transferase
LGMENAPPEWLIVLDDSERARAGNFVRATDRLAYVAAHALKRSVLAQAFPDQSAAALRFVADCFGKPFLAEGTGLQFNLSHTVGLIALAVSFRSPVGIDVETLGAPLCRDAMQSVLNASEHAALARAADWDDAFLALWTAKEAVIKAEGMGLSLPLSAIEVQHDRAIGPSRRWTLWRSRPTSRHVLTLAWDGKDDAVEDYRLCGADLTAWAANEGNLKPSLRGHQTSLKPDHRGYCNANLR